MSKQIGRKAMVVGTVPPDGYPEKLEKLIPAKLVGAFVTLWALLQGNEPALMWVAILMLVAAPFFTRYVDGVTDVIQIAVTTISFAIWIFVIHGAFIVPGLHTPELASAVIVGWTTIAPVLFPPDK